MSKRLRLGPEIERYTQLLARDPNSLAFVPLADAYRKSGLFEEAFAVLKRGVSRRPAYLPAKIVLGKCYLDLGNYMKAESTFDEVLDDDEDNLVALNAIAEVRRHEGRFAEAAAIYRRIIVLNPADSHAAEQLAFLEGGSAPQSNRTQEKKDVIEIKLDEEIREPAPEPQPQKPVESPVPSGVEASGGNSDDFDFDAAMRGEAPKEKPSAVKAPTPPARKVEKKTTTEIDLGAEEEDESIGVEEHPAEPEHDTGTETSDGGPSPDVPVPPPPVTDELSLSDTAHTEVMDDDEAPPIQPPVKNIQPLVTPTSDNGKDVSSSFGSWLTNLSGKKESDSSSE
ncbi:tetratricopeptide repeat protein [bacterium]|nr:tetratricopeptide repeat protein [bacterium]